MENEKKKNKKQHTISLPQDLIMEILLRLPVKSLLRFKIVCKPWGSLISNSQFAKSHFDLAAAPTYRLLLRSTNFYIESIEASLRDDSAVADLLLRPPSPPYRTAYGIKAIQEKVEVLGCCRGVALLLYDRGDFIIWNPSTGDYQRLSDSDPELASHFYYAFGYDESTDDFMVVLVSLNDPEFGASDWPTEILVLTLKNNSWKLLEGSNVMYRDLDGEFKAGSSVNWAVHWLVFSEEKKVPVIITFDLLERTLSEIPLPHCLTVESVYEIYGLRVIGGCLAVCCSVQGQGRPKDEIWMMKEYKVQSYWTKTFVVSTNGNPHNHFSPIHITKEGEIFGSNSRGRLEKLNAKGEMLQSLRFGRAKRWYRGNLQSALYRETLLPLPLVIEETGNN